MTLEPWNNSSILPPPVNMFLCHKKFDITALKHVCNTIIKVLSKQSPLHKESALCSRFVYKYARKFRNDIGFRDLRKTNAALKKYLMLDLFKDIQDFFMALPSETDDEKYLPTKQMLEYVMLRIITFSTIILRICVCSKQAAIFYLDRIKRGESHWMSLLPYAMLCRIWSISKVLIQHSTTWYSNLHPFLNKLELKGLNFLPDSYVLPEDLEDWLDLKNIDYFGKFNWKTTKSVAIDNVSLDDDESDFMVRIFNYTNTSTVTESEQVDEELKLIIKECKDQIISNPLTTNNIDQGEVLSRESFKNDSGQLLSRESSKYLSNTPKIDYRQTNKIDKPIIKDHTVSRNKDSAHSYKNIANSESLKKFIEKEESYRNECDGRSFTNHLSLMQWHSLKKILLQLSNSLTNKNIKKKFERIWKERCLDYK